MMIDPASGRPAYQQIADVLRQRIERGVYAPGQKLPSESKLIDEFDVSRVVARLAIGEIRNDGLIYSQQGKGSFVRERGKVRRIGSERYRESVNQIKRHGIPQPPKSTTFTQDQGINWNQYELDKSFREVPVSGEVAELLELDADRPDYVLERDFVFYADGRPRQLSTSSYPLDLVKGTPVADPGNEPWPGGNIAQLATLGVFVTRVEESVQSRMPTQDERRILRISDGIPVFVVTRRMIAGDAKDQPVEAATVVFAARDVALDYTIDLDT